MKLLVSTLMGFFVSLGTVDALAYGQATNATEHPYFVAVTFQTQPDSEVHTTCPGTVISPSLVVTALSCISAGLVDMEAIPQRIFRIFTPDIYIQCNVEEESRHVWKGDNLWHLADNYEYKDETCDQYRIYRLMHPQNYIFEFNRGYSKATNNFAILETKDRTFEEAPFVLPICSPREYFNIDHPSFTWSHDDLQKTVVYNNEKELWIVSTGYDVHGNPSPGLMEQRVEFWYNKSGNGCGNYRASPAHAPEPDAGVCTKGPGLCLNDYGAPLILKDKQRGRCLYGVASHSLLDQFVQRTAKMAISECYGIPFCAWFYQDVFMVPHKFLECPIFYGFAEDGFVQ